MFTDVYGRSSVEYKMVINQNPFGLFLIGIVAPELLPLFIRP